MWEFDECNYSKSARSLRNKLRLNPMVARHLTVVSHLNDGKPESMVRVVKDVV